MYLCTKELWLNSPHITGTMNIGTILPQTYACHNYAIPVLMSYYNNAYATTITN